MHGHGTTLSGATTGTIGDILSINIGDQARVAVNESDMDSTDKFDEFVPGMIDAGEITFELIMDSANFDVLQDAVEAAAEAWTVTFPESSTFVATGFVIGLGASIPYEDKITCSATIKISGKPTFSVGGTTTTAGA